jgi:hypothetical protein
MKPGSTPTLLLIFILATLSVLVLMGKGPAPRHSGTRPGTSLLRSSAGPRTEKQSGVAITSQDKADALDRTIKHGID